MDESQNSKTGSSRCGCAKFKDGYGCERCPEGYGVLKGPRGNVKLERSGGLAYLVGGEGQHVFPALLKHGSVDGGYCRVDVDMEHLRAVRSRVHDVHVHADETTTSSTG